MTISLVKQYEISVRKLTVVLFKLKFESLSVNKVFSINMYINNENRYIDSEAKDPPKLQKRLKINQ